MLVLYASWLSPSNYKMKTHTLNVHDAMLSTHDVSDTGAIISQTCHNSCLRATATRSSGGQEGGS